MTDLNINYFMLEALNMADLAFKNNEVPVGALRWYSEAGAVRRCIEVAVRLVQ